VTVLFTVRPDGKGPFLVTLFNNSELFQNKNHTKFSKNASKQKKGLQNIFFGFWIYLDSRSDSDFPMSQ